MFKIVTVPNCVLSTPTKLVLEIDNSIKKIVSDMERVLIAQDDPPGVGLAANQVGILKQIIVVLVNNEPKVMINPEILDFSREYCIMNEGCLSFPQQFYDIQRPERVKVKYRGLNGHPMIEWHEGIEARCILHEIDHIRGIVFTEKLNG